MYRIPWILCSEGKLCIHGAGRGYSGKLHAAIILQPSARLAVTFAVLRSRGPSSRGLETDFENTRTYAQTHGQPCHTRHRCAHDADPLKRLVPGIYGQLRIWSFPPVAPRSSPESLPPLPNWED